MQSPIALEHLTDDELLRRLGELVSRSRRVEADLVAHLGEVEKRRLYAREAAPSMFAYCRERLHLSEAEAYLRIRVARAARRHPVLLDMLRDGRLHLSAIVRLLPVITRDNRDAVLARARHASKRQVLELVAELSPRPDVPTRIRRLPQRAFAAVSPSRHAPEPPVLAGGSASRLAAGVAMGGVRSGDGDSAGRLCPGTVEGSSAAPGADLSAALCRSQSEPGILSREAQPRGPLAAGGAADPGTNRSSQVLPLSPGRYKVQFTASAGLRDKLERLQALMRSQVPDGDLAALVELAVSEKLQRLEARRFGKTSAPRKGLSDTDTSAASRHVPAAVRRVVSERDGRRCGFVDAQGRRCTERDRLELHHRHPFGLGGGHDPTNVSLLCRAHNLLMARCDYGAAP